MKMLWLIENKLASFDERVRVELGPQVIEFDCTDENLLDTVTASHYKLGKRDALGRLIRPDELINNPKIDTRQLEAIVAIDKKNGLKQLSKKDKMVCVDWDQKHKPFIWKIYQKQKIGELGKDGEEIEKFIKVGEELDKDKALKIGRKLYEEMK